MRNFSISVSKTHPLPAAECEVTLNGGGYTRTYTVTVSDAYLESLGLSDRDPADVIRAAFEFLLDRESPDEILTGFDLTVIKTYFPAFEEWVKTKLNA